MDWSPDGWGDVLAILGIIAAVVGVIDWRIRTHIDNRLLTVRDSLRDDITKNTRQIQSGYRNGGESLADIAHELGRIRIHLGMEAE